jgi:hypothetical protein
VLHTSVKGAVGYKGNTETCSVCAEYSLIDQFVKGTGSLMIRTPLYRIGGPISMPVRKA